MTKLDYYESRYKFGFYVYFWIFFFSADHLSHKFVKSMHSCDINADLLGDLLSFTSLLLLLCYFINKQL